MTTGTGTSEGVRILISEEPENKEWLYKIMEGEEPPRRSKPRIQKVAQILRGIKSNETCFDPSVVSFGPIHHDRHDHLETMERYKEVTARWFILLQADDVRVNATNRERAENVYDEFVAKAPSMSSLRDCYDTDSFDYNDADLMRMMFLDGCFTLYFIHLVVKGSHDLTKSGHLNQPLIIRDMFLLENQIPYSILQALMSLKPKHPFQAWVFLFIYMVFLPPRKSPLRVSLSILKDFNQVAKLFLKVFKSNEGGMPLHLLDFLRSLLVGKVASSSSHVSGYWHYYFCPISELKAAGIQVRASNSQFLTDIKLKGGFIDSHLELPKMIVDDSTKTLLLNLIAYEMCPDGLLDHAVASYVCFFDSLIYNADDVKELRSNKILHNGLGSDEEVANLFQEMATGLSPEYNAYSKVIDDMERHNKRHFNHFRVWISEFICSHFTSPWTAISLNAAIFAILLTLVETTYSVLSYYKRE